MESLRTSSTTFSNRLVREKVQPNLTALAAASCPSLDQDPLANPRSWPGYLTFVSSNPYDKEPIIRPTLFDFWDEDGVERSEDRLPARQNLKEIPRFDYTKFNKMRYSVAYQYPVKTCDEGVQVSDREC